MDTSTTHVLTKDERLMQKEMIQMYHDGKTTQEVVRRIISKDIEPARADYLAEKFREDYDFLIHSKKRKARAGSETNIIVGTILLAGGVLMTLLTYTVSQRGGLIFYGAILVGAGFLIKGFIDKNQKSKAVN